MSKRFMEDQYRDKQYSEKLKEELTLGRKKAEPIIEEKKKELEEKPPEKNLPESFNPRSGESFLSPRGK